ncbi:MAG: hypothetical protein AB7I30_02370 [Isosphaeraceae bacterium]
MPIPPQYRTLLYKLDALKRKAGYLDLEVSWETLTDFAIVAHSLNDWIKEDSQIPERVKEEATKILNTPEIQACRYIANLEKHRELTKPTKYPPQALEPDVQRGYGLGRWGEGGWGIGEEEITITMLDGTSFDALDLAVRAVKLWEDFFDRNGLR